MVSPKRKPEGEEIAMSGIFTPGNIIVLAIVLVALYFGGCHIIGSFRGQSCCTDADDRPHPKQVKVEDTDLSHYPYEADIMVNGMSCANCVKNVTNALNAIPGTLAKVSLEDSVAHVHAKQPIDEAVYEQAIKDAGYYVPHL